VKPELGGGENRRAVGHPIGAIGPTGGASGTAERDGGEGGAADRGEGGRAWVAHEDQRAGRDSGAGRRHGTCGRVGTRSVAKS